MSSRADKAAKNGGEQPVGIGLVEIATLFLSILADPRIAQLFASCKKQPPAPPPVPQPLADAGVTPGTWKNANDAKFASQQSVAKNKKGFHAGVVNQTAIEIAKQKGIKKKAAKPMAIASLQTGLDESVEDIALAMQEVTNEAASVKAAFAAMDSGE